MLQHTQIKKLSNKTRHFLCLKKVFIVEEHFIGSESYSQMSFPNYLGSPQGLSEKVFCDQPFFRNPPKTHQKLIIKLGPAS